MTEYEKKCLTCKNNYKPSDCAPRCNCMCENHNMYEPIINYERIKRMSIEDMAKFLSEEVGCSNCPNGDNTYCNSTDCYKHFFYWLRGEVDDK